MSALRTAVAVALVLWPCVDGFAPSSTARAGQRRSAAASSGVLGAVKPKGPPVGTPPSPVPAPTVAALEGWFAASHHELAGGVVISAASTLPGVLAQTWASIAKAADDDRILLFPSCELLAKPGMIEGLMDRKFAPPAFSRCHSRSPNLSVDR